MSRPPDVPRLPDDAEALLTAWPEPHRDALDWEQMADQTLARVREVEVDSKFDALLEPPLPASEGEPAEFVPDPDATTDAPSDLSEIARLAVNGQAPSAELDEVAKETWALAVKARPISLEQSSKPPRAARTAAAAALQAPSRSDRTLEPELARSEPPPPAAPRRKWAGASVFGAAGALAAAAVLIAYVRTREEAAAPQAQVAPATATPPAKSPVEEPVKPAQPQQEPARTLGLDSLPREAEAVAKSAAPAKAKGGGAAVATGPSVTLSQRKEPSGNTPAQAVELKEEDEEEVLQPAGRSTSIPEKPSAGAVSVAFASVAGSAKQCIAGQEAGSTVTVTFGPDGRVARVAVAGPASGTPAAGCLETAFRKARLEPFGAPDFTASWTVTPP